MTISESTAAALALIALVLALEGVTRGGQKQLFAGLLFGLAAALAFSFGDGLSSFNLQMIDQLPRWRDVAHPLPAPEPVPAPQPSPKAEIVIAEQTYPTQLHINQETSIKQIVASPRFYPIYPREVFMPDVDWKNPAVPALVPLYDALEKGDWQGAIALNYDAIRQADVLPMPAKGVRYYRGHVLWLWAIAKLESGDPERALGILSKAQEMITYPRTGNSDQLRMMIDTALFSDFANVPNHNLPHQVDGINSQDQAMIHYAEALYYKGVGDNYDVDVHLNQAKAIADNMDVRGLHGQAARLRSVFAAQFPQ